MTKTEEELAKSGEGESAGEPSTNESIVALMNRHETQLTDVARLLHDDVNQILSAAGLHLDILRMEFESQAPNIGEKTGEIQKLLGEAIERLRKLSHDINPDIVGRVGLNYSLEQLVARAREADVGGGPTPQIRLRLDPLLRLPKPIARSFYKVAEAALDNALRHGGGSPVELVLQGKANSATLEVRDIGPGYNVEHPPRQGLGLVLMRYYANLVGAVLEIDSTGKGTIVTILVNNWV
jgi:two-component system, LuxR family, sensor kinase FixL